MIALLGDSKRRQKKVVKSQFPLFAPWCLHRLSTKILNFLVEKDEPIGPFFVCASWFSDGSKESSIFFVKLKRRKLKISWTFFSFYPLKNKCQLIISDRKIWIPKLLTFPVVWLVLLQTDISCLTILVKMPHRMFKSFHVSLWPNVPSHLIMNGGGKKWTQKLAVSTSALLTPSLSIYFL